MFGEKSKEVFRNFKKFGLVVWSLLMGKDLHMCASLFCLVLIYLVVGKKGPLKETT